jgi:hypothetical protein
MQERFEPLEKMRLTDFDLGRNLTNPNASGAGPVPGHGAISNRGPPTL